MRKFYPLLLLCFLINTLDAGAQKKYNVVFIIVDDMSIAFEPYGNLQAPTPNFLRLMQHGMLFKEAYCQYPLCSPSRTSLLSGQRPDSTGVVNNKTDVRWKLGSNYRFLPEYFHDYGYRTESFGKVGPCRHDEQISWDYVFQADRTESHNVDHIPTWWIDTAHKTESEVKDGINVDSLLVKLRHPFATPYFYGLGLSTHNPFTPLLVSWNKTGDPTTQELVQLDRYGTKGDVKGNSSKPIILPDTPPNDTADIPLAALKPLLAYSNKDVRDIRHAYYAEIIEMDVHLGYVLDVLDSLNVWERSVVIFVTDHGLHMGEHEGLWLKNTLFEEALRVPFVICAPGKMKGICTRPVEMVDVFPTLAELCGLPAPLEMQGSSLVPLLENPDAKWKDAIFAQRVLDLHFHNADDPQARAVRTARYHYNTWLQSGEELYDIVNDPKEYTNLVNDSAHQDVLNRMRKLLAKGWQGVSAPNYAQASYYRDADGDGYGNSNVSRVAYFKPDGYAIKGGDCDDNIKDIYPGSMKLCNSIALSDGLSLPKKVSLVPNPSTNSVIVTYNSNTACKIELKIFDPVGRIVFSKTATAATGNNSYQLSLSNLKPGVYDLEVNNGILPQQTKLLIER